MTHQKTCFLSMESGTEAQSINDTEKRGFACILFHFLSSIPSSSPLSPPHLLYPLLISSIPSSSPLSPPPLLYPLLLSSIPSSSPLSPPHLLYPLLISSILSSSPLAAASPVQ
ncbi:hypothetical protein, partial [Methanocalculus sp. MSAO_Arc2]|uniref:hypothetical protein n=1 Tax=Methanocalculus sp. MSAO_Arc2 TaxID=2293855 RepID=UPI0032171C66